MKPGKILHTRVRHQRRQPGNEIQRFKDDMVFCRIPVLENLNTTIYTIEEVCLAVPASASVSQMLNHSHSIVAGGLLEIS
jgi:hypothetical protein